MTLRLVYLYSITAIINVILNLVLIPRLGMLAAAISTFVSFLAFLIMLFISVRNRKLLEIDLVFCLKVCISAAVAGAIVNLLPKSNFAWVILDIAVFGIAYLCIIVVTRAFDRESLRKIKDDFTASPNKRFIA